MKGPNEVYKVGGSNTLGQLVTETLNASNSQKSELDWLIPHQANIRIIGPLRTRSDLPMTGDREPSIPRQYIGRVGTHGLTPEFRDGFG